MPCSAPHPQRLCPWVLFLTPSSPFSQIHLQPVRKALTPLPSSVFSLPLALSAKEGRFCEPMGRAASPPAPLTSVGEWKPFSGATMGLAGGWGPTRPRGGRPGAA